MKTNSPKCTAVIPSRIRLKRTERLEAIHRQTLVIFQKTDRPDSCESLWIIERHKCPNSNREAVRLNLLFSEVGMKNICSPHKEGNANNRPWSHQKYKTEYGKNVNSRTQKRFFYFFVLKMSVDSAYCAYFGWLSVWLMSWKVNGVLMYEMDNFTAIF